MKRMTTAVLTLCMLMLTVVSVFAAITVESPADCLHCGMSRKAFAHSRALVEYQDGKKSGTCSINCAVVDLNKNQVLKLKSLTVADYGTKKLIDATTASWVIGGKVRGVMTSVPKWAFAGKDEAQKFIKKSGGKLATYKEVLEAVNAELKAEEQNNHDQEHQHKH